MKRILALLLAAAVCLSLCGCGEEPVGPYAVLEEIGTKEYAAIYRTDDVIPQVVEAAISSLAATGTLSRLAAQWLGSSEYIGFEGDFSALNEVEMPAPRTLMVGVDTDSPPFAYTSGGELVGFTVDLGNAIGSVIGWDVRIIPVRSDEIETQLSSGNIDCALGFSPLCVDPTAYEVGTVLMKSEVVIAVPESSDVKSIRRIRGERIGTISDPALEEAINAHSKIVKHSDGATVYVTPPRCISAMENGWCVAIVMDILMLRAYASAYVPESFIPGEIDFNR